MKQLIIKPTFSFILILTLCFGLNIQAQQVAAWTKIDTNAIMIGQQVNMEIGLSSEEGLRVDWPFFGDTLSSNIEVLNKSAVDTLVEKGVRRMIQQLTITSFDSGYFKIPSINIQYQTQGDTMAKFATAGSLYLQVNVPVVDTSQSIKPIAGPISEPYTFMEILPWILLGLLIIAVIVFLVLYLRKRKRNQPLFVRKAKPALPPHILAITKLEELRLAKVWQSGKLKQYHSEVTDIIREYLDNRYHFNDPEMTSDEILHALKGLKINNEVYGKLSGVLFLADMVKFAKAQPTALENDLSLSHCVDFVNETKEDSPVNNEIDQPVESETTKTNNH